MGEQTPVGIRVLPSCPNIDRNFTYRLFIFVFTYLCYASYHISRKPISIVKSVLHRNCSVPLVDGGDVYPANSTACDWEPFDHANYSTLFGGLDLAYLFAYAVGMFFSGHVAERINLRHFVSLGMIVSGIFTAAFGLGYFLQIHGYWFYVIVMIVAGFVQSTGWPSMIACMGSWFGKGKRGFIMGVWNSNCSVGNILGSLLAGMFVNAAWGWSFVVPGIVISALGIVAALVLVTNPAQVGCSPPEHYGPGVFTSDTQSTDIAIAEPDADAHDKKTSHGTALLVKESNPIVTYTVVNGTDCPPSTRVKFESESSDIDNDTRAISNLEISDGVANEDDVEKDANDVSSHNGAVTGCTQQEEKGGNALTETQQPLLVTKTDVVQPPISFWNAVRIPGVVEFSLCFFFAKLVSYTFLFWLPMYISVKRPDYDAEVSGYLSTLFDVGGIIGGIAAGVLSDITGARALTCIIGLALAAPLMYVYNLYGSIDMAHNIGLLIVCGLTVTGPHALITTAISTDLGTHRSLRGNAKALATVTSIIEGTGSIGAAIGPLLTGVISPTGWQNVFYMLIAANVCAMVLLSRLVLKEIQASRFFRWGRADTEVTVLATTTS